MDFKELTEYQKAFNLAIIEIFSITKQFLKEEKYSLKDQIRRSSRATCENIAEAYRKRKYPKHFIKRLTDSDGANNETVVWPDFALNCGYMNYESHDSLYAECLEIRKTFELHDE